MYPINELNLGTTNYTVIEVVGDPGIGNAYREYSVYRKSESGKYDDTYSLNTDILFQEGPIKENGVNGCQHEDLLNIVLHRLQCFQTSEYKCEENQLAIEKLEQALQHLRDRTNKRVERNVEGTSQI